MRSATLQGGDVLVCQSSSVSWSPLCTSAAAVVTDVGGPLSHAAVVAREFGIPAVVGTSVALSTLVDGELLEVDGSAGIVRRLEAQPATSSTIGSSRSSPRPGSPRLGIAAANAAAVNSQNKARSDSVETTPPSAMAMAIDPSIPPK